MCGMGVPVSCLFSTSSRVVGVSLLLAHRSIWLISTYIEHSDALGLSELCTHLRNWKNTLGRTPLIVGGDFKARSCLWGPPNVPDNENARKVLDFVRHHHVHSLNVWDFDCPPSFVHLCGAPGWIDLTLVSPNLGPQVNNWHVEEMEDTFYDNAIINFVLLVA